MKKKKNNWLNKPGILVCLCVLIWFAFWLLPSIVCWLKPMCLHSNIGKEYIDFNMTFAAAGALFTGLAFAGTIWNIWQDKNKVSNILDETSLKVFNNIFDKTMNDPEFRKSESYILNGSFLRDLKTLKSPINVEDLKKIGKQRRNINGQMCVVNPYKAVVYYCDRMDYFGMVLRYNYIDNKILDYWGNTIITSYVLLKDLFENTINKQKNIFYYINFRYLYCQALERKGSFMREVEKMDKELTEIEQKYCEIVNY